MGIRLLGLGGEIIIGKRDLYYLGTSLQHSIHLVAQPPTSQGYVVEYFT